MVLTWQFPVTVTKNCDPSVIHVTESPTDSAAEVSSTQPASVAVQQMPIESRTKKIKLLELTDPWDSKYCLTEFNNFSLVSPENTDLSNIFDLLIGVNVFEHL